MVSTLLSLPVKVMRRLQRGRAVEFEGLMLPPARMRLGGAHFRDDRAFVESGREDVRKLAGAFGLDASTSILDVGCGVGRLPIGLLAEFGQVDDYAGVDVDQSSIAWCKRFIEARHPNLRFTLLNVANERYNRSGQSIDETFRLPWEADRFEAIFLYSVFSHMESDDIRVYLREFARLLRSGGGVFLTAFVEEGVPDEEVNPRDYGPRRWRGALHCVRFSREFLTGLVGEAGFAVARLDHGSETDGQSALYLRRRDRI